MKVIYIILVSIALSAACVDNNTTSTEQLVCTEEDVNNGTCGDPGGGSPPNTLPEDTDSYADSIVLSGGYQPTGVRSRVCAGPGPGSCTVRINLWGGEWLQANCWVVSQGGPEHCSSWHCWPREGGGSVCTPID